MRQVILFVCQCAVWLPVHVLSKLGDCVTGLLGVGQEWAQLWVCVKRSPGGLVLLWLLQARAQEHTVTQFKFWVFTISHYLDTVV